ncbi:hypothetical protein ACWCL1_04475 [Ligilactobacillus sp. LYQ135]
MKIVGLVIALTIYPPAMMDSVLITAGLIAIPAHLLETKFFK